jgi:NHL repeat
MLKPVYIVAEAFLLLFGAGGMAVAQEASLAGRKIPIAKFVAMPKVVKDGQLTRITFAVSVGTDVQVAILDAKGNVVRHLAAGLLGKNAPKPFKKNSLSQSLIWDFTNDYGEKLPAGQYTIRVGLGLKPEFDRMLGYQPNTLDVLRGLVVSPEGELFVINLGRHMHAHFGSTLCSVFDREGAYQRTIMPYQAKCFPESVKEFGVLDLGDHGKHPLLHASHLKSIYPFAAEAYRQQMTISPDGRRMILIMKVRGKGPILMAVDVKDGGVPEGGAFGPSLGGKGMSASAYLAFASAGDTIYVSGVAVQPRWKPAVPKHAIYRAKWGKKEITPFIGKPDEAGKDETHLNSPGNLALDKDGNIYVTDRGNNRIAVFNPQGKFLNALPVEKPWMLGLHKKSGTVFVLAGGDPPTRIVRFAGRKSVKPTYIQDIPGVFTKLKGKKRQDLYALLAVGDSAGQPIVWIGSTIKYDRFRLLRFTEADGKLGNPEEKGRGKGFISCRDIQVDRKREELYINQGFMYTPFQRINGFNGKILKEFGSRLSVGKCVTYGQDGYIYSTTGYGKSYICRFDRDGKPVNFKGRDSNKSDAMELPLKNSQHLMSRGIVARPDGTVYLLQETGKGTHCQYSVSEWGPDGKMRKKKHIAMLSQGALSLRIDPAGNFYVGDPVKPFGQPVPPAFLGKVDASKKRSGDVKHHYPIMYGSILKFGSGGGVGVGPDVQGEKGLLAYDVPVGVKDVQWRYFGVGPIPACKGGTYNHFAMRGCSCEGMRFDVDGFGRTFAPDAARFRVVVLDTAGNLICTFGSYANQDSAGPKSTLPEPTIPFAFPLAVGVSDRAAYVSDILSRRLVRVKLTCLVSGEVKVSAP